MVITTLLSIKIIKKNIEASPMLKKSGSGTDTLCTCQAEKLKKLNLSTEKFLLNEVNHSSGKCSRKHTDCILLMDESTSENTEDNCMPYRKDKQILDVSEILFSDEEYLSETELLDSSLRKLKFKTCLNFSHSRSDSELNLSNKSEKINLVKNKSKISIEKETLLPDDDINKKWNMISDNESSMAFSNQFSQKCIIASDSDNNESISLNKSYIQVNQHLQEDNLNSVQQKNITIKDIATIVYASNSDSSEEDNFENYISSVKKKLNNEKKVFDNYDSDFIVSDNANLEYYSTSLIKKNEKTKSRNRTNSKDTRRKKTKSVVLSSSSEFEDSSRNNPETSLPDEKYKVRERKNIRGTNKKKIFRENAHQVINSSLSDSEDNSVYIFENSSPEEDREYNSDYSDTSSQDKNYLVSEKKHMKETDLKKICGKNTEQEIIIFSSGSEKEYEIRERDLRSETAKRKSVIKKQVAVENNCEKLSFISSFDQDTPLSQAHADAIPYLKNFKKLRKELAYKLYTLYNAKIFDNRLPHSMVIKWNPRLTKTAGYFYYIDEKKNSGRNSQIDLSIKVLDSPGRLRDTLIHEMCHAATRIISEKNEAHGPIWKSWASKANKVFPELSLIKRCHSYEIKCKYTYRCVTCGYSFGRHSKSLDTKSKVCGHCHGKFELTVNCKNGARNRSTNSQLGLPGSLSTPRTPAPFALFVKDNYELIKKSQNNMKHKDVMQELSKQFAMMKMENLELK